VKGKLQLRGRDERVKWNFMCVATSHDVQKKFLTQDTVWCCCVHWRYGRS